MKKIYTLLMLLLPLSMMAQINYLGNTRSGFGGTVGNGSFNISDNGTNITLVFTRGSANFNDALIIYIDNGLGGGFASTAGFIDAGDVLRKAISGFNGGFNRSVVNFPNGFRPQFAIAASTVQSFGGLWGLANGTNNSLNFVGSVNLTPTSPANATTFTMTFSKASIGITGAVNFNFLATYTSLSDEGFRSNEGIGFTGPTNNPGFNPLNPTSFFNYPTGALPVSILNLERATGAELGKLFFTTSDESSVSRYDIEASNDAVNWLKISSINSRNSLNGSRYDVVDSRATKSTQFYRIKAVSFTGEVKFSNVVKIAADNKEKITLATNVVQSQLVFNTMMEETSRINISVMDMSGRIVTNQTTTLLGGFSQQRMSIANLATGMYIVVFDDSKGYRQSAKFIKQ